MADEAVEVQEQEADINPFETREIADVQQPPVEVKPAVIEDKPVEEIKDEVAEVKAEAEPIEKQKPSTVDFAEMLNGQEDEIYNYLNEKRTLSSVDKLTPEEQIKLNLKYANPDFSQEEIDGLFSETFEKPEKPEQAFDELDEDFEARTAKWDKKVKTFENKLSREAKSAAKQLAEKYKELPQPNIKSVNEPTPEELVEAEKVQKKQLQDYLQSIDKGVSEFSGFNTVFKDGEVEIPIKYSISAEEKAALKPILQDFNVNDYYTKRWYNPDGTWNGKQQAEDVYWMEFRQKIMDKVANEAGSQRLAAHIKEAKNIDFNGGTQRGYAPTKVAPEDAMADFFFSQR